MSPEAKTESAGAASAQEGSLLDEILAETKVSKNSDGYDVTRKGVQAFIAEMLGPKRAQEKVDKNILDGMIAEIDQRLSAQVNEILHNAQVQQLESAWRSLKYVIDKVDFRENIRVEIVNATKEDLFNDFEDTPEIPKSGLYRTVYSNEYGVFGGKPYGLICGNFDFGPGPQDLQLLGKLASVAAMAHAPLITNSSPEFFGEQSYLPLPAMKDLDSLFEGPSTRAGARSARARTRDR